MTYTGAFSNAPLYLKAAYQFGGELAANEEGYRQPNKDERDDIAGYWKDGAAWDDMPKDAQALARQSWNQGYQAERATQ
jgi:hypothetical protein